MSKADAESSRHHYIPQFFIKGFTNKNGITYVYDKQKDTVLERDVSPKQIFFDWNRNTVTTDKGNSSAIEDKYYKELDKEFAETISIYRNSANTDWLHEPENVARLQFFLVHLFWRIPKLDFAFDQIFDDIIVKDENGQEIKLSELDEPSLDAMKKLERAFFPNKVVKGIKRQDPSRQICSQFFDKKVDAFVLGDYPMIYRYEPQNTDEIIGEDVLFPVSSQRLYKLSENKNLMFEFEKVVLLNAMIIDQSVNYVCSPNRDYLGHVIEYYKAFTNLHTDINLRDYLFS